MECAMLYHTEILVGLFVILGCFQSAGLASLFVVDVHHQYHVTILEWIMTICLAITTTYEIHIISLSILTLVAHSVLGVMQFFIGVVLPLLFCQTAQVTSVKARPLQRTPILALGLFLLVLGLQCVGKLFDWQSRFCLALLVVVYVSTIRTTAAVMAIRHNTNHSTLRQRLLSFPIRNGQQDAQLLAFAATFFVICPFLVAGKIVALISEPDRAGLIEELSAADIDFADYLPSSGLRAVTIHLLLPIAIRVGWVHFQILKVGPNHDDKSEKVDIQPNMVAKLRVASMVVTILFLGPSLFQMGQGFGAGNLLVALSWLECLFLPF